MCYDAGAICDFPIHDQHFVLKGQSVESGDILLTYAAGHHQHDENVAIVDSLLALVPFGLCLFEAAVMPEVDPNRVSIRSDLPDRIICRFVRYFLHFFF